MIKTSYYRMVVEQAARDILLGFSTLETTNSYLINSIISLEISMQRKDLEEQ